jgi:hypothetical protein
LGFFGKAKNDRQCATLSRIGALSTFYRPLTPARAVRIGPKKEGIAPLHHWREKGFLDWDGTDGHGGSICAMFGPLIYARSRTTSNQIYILVSYLQDGVPRGHYPFFMSVFWKTAQTNQPPKRRATMELQSRGERTGRIEKTDIRHVRKNIPGPSRQLNITLVPGTGRTLACCN